MALNQPLTNYDEVSQYTSFFAFHTTKTLHIVTPN